MDLQLNQKVIIVTGGSSGIGEAITRTLVAEGARVMIATNAQGPTEALAHELGDAVAFVIGELEAENVCASVVQQTLERMGPIYGIVNNAGVNDSKGLADGPLPFRRSLERNLWHYFDLVSASLDSLKAEQGSIVNISSKVAVSGQGGTSGYAAAKGAILGLTREWAADLSGDNINVNAILPAEVMTPLYRSWLDQHFADPAAQEAVICGKIPLGKRMTTPQEIASMVAFLLSPLSAHTTGQLISVDGGYLHLDRGLT